MLLQSVRPNIVQAIRAFRPEELQQAAHAVGHHFLYTNLSAAQDKQAVLDIIARDFLFPDHFGKNLDALYDCMTDLVHKSGPQPGFVVVLELIPGDTACDRETREQLLDALGVAADAGYERNIDSHIKSLRAKLRQVAVDAEPIQTHRGLGYSYSPRQA